MAIFKKKQIEVDYVKAVNEALDLLANLMTNAKAEGLDVGFSINWSDEHKRFIPKPRIIKVLHG